MSVLNIIFRLYLPLFIFIVFIIGILTIKKTDNDKIRISLLGFISIPLPINSTIVAKVVLIFISSVVVMLYYLFFDFSKMFPERFEMIVHFNDQNGIEKMLKEFDITEINGYDIVIKSDSTLAQYFNFGDNEIKDIFHYENYYSDVLFNEKSPVETMGSTTFKVKKLSGIHNYRITESNGILNHKKLNENINETEKWSSKFTKVSSANDLIEIQNVSQLFSKIILAPKFNQSIITSGKDETKMEHTLYGITYIKPLPYPIYSGTIYLIKREDKLIPIGFAKNYSE